MEKSKQARARQIREALANEARRRGYSPHVVDILDGEQQSNDAAIATLSSLASLGKLWRRNQNLSVSELLSLWQEKANDPARITRIILLLGEAWREQPNLSLTQLLRKAYALGVDAQQPHSLKHADDEAIEAGLRKMIKTTSGDDPLKTLGATVQETLKTFWEAWQERDTVEQ